MIHSTRIIILNVTKVGEKSLVLHALSPDLGRRSYIVSVGPKGGMALYLPLNILECEVVENPKSDLWRLRGITAVHPLNGIRSNMYKNTMSLFMSEVLYRAVREGVCEKSLFEWCEQSILTLDALESDFSNFHLRFLLELSSAMGFSPCPEDLMPFAGRHLSDIRDLLAKDFASSLLVPLSGEVRCEIAESLLQYLSFHTDSRIEARSLKVLREVYG